MSKKILFALLLLPFLLSFSWNYSALELMKKMFVTTDGIKTLRYQMVKRERIKGKMIEQQCEVKMVRQPLQVYLHQQKPHAGLEVLYVHGQNNNKALINPNGFPWVNVSLDPDGDRMRENQHHSIREAGFEYVMSVLKFLSAKYSNTVQNMIRLEGMTEMKGKSCYKIVLDNPNFKYVPYMVKQGETVLSIARQFKVNEYMILEKNHFSGYGDARTGQVIQIPNDYSSRMVMYIEKTTFLPFFMEVYDDQGLFEEYNYREVTLNPVFEQGELSSEYKTYGF